MIIVIVAVIMIVLMMIIGVLRMIVLIFMVIVVFMMIFHVLRGRDRRDHVRRASLHHRGHRCHAHDDAPHAILYTLHLRHQKLIQHRTRGF